MGRRTTIRTQVYILVQVLSGKMQDVCEKIKKINEITLADVITGGFDVIANVDLPSYSDLKYIVDTIQKIYGVVQTLTCVSLYSCGSTNATTSI